MTQPVATHQETFDTTTIFVSGALYYGYRFYSPGLGRWLSNDPINELGLSLTYLGSFKDNVFANAKVDNNLYVFCLNMPVGEIDILGLQNSSCNICGQEVENATYNTISLVARRFNMLTNPQKARACSLDTFSSNWDILFDVGYGNGCGQGLRKCEQSVMFRGVCYDMYEVNYLMWGFMGNLCRKDLAWMQFLAMSYKLWKYRRGETPTYEYNWGLQGWINIGYYGFRTDGSRTGWGGEWLPSSVGRDGTGVSECERCTYNDCGPSAFNTHWPVAGSGLFR